MRHTTGIKFYMLSVTATLNGKKIYATIQIHCHQRMCVESYISIA